MRVNPERKEEKERLALALLRVTLRLAAAHGFVSLGLREVSRSAGMAPTSFYRHFADMEELGLSVIHDLAAPVLSGWAGPGEDAAGDAAPPFEAIADRALSTALRDPDLLRFVVAERVGAIPAFRAALDARLAPLREGVRQSLRVEGPEAEHTADAAVVLVLDACARVLERGAEEAPRVRERLLRQVRALSAGVKGAR